MADDEICSGFEPQTYLKERCKKCFRLKSKHVPESTPAAAAAAAPSASSTTPLRPVERRMSWRDKVYGGPPGTAQSNTASVTTNDSDAAAGHDSGGEGGRSGGLSPQGSERRRGARSPKSDDDSVSVVSFKSANSGGARGRLSSAKSYESLTSNGDAKSMVTALSGGSDDEERASTPTEQLDGGEIKMLQTQLELARDKISMLEAEMDQLKRDGDHVRPRSRLESSDSDSGNERLALLDERLSYTESMCQDYRDENTVLKCELRELQESISKGGSTESKQLKDKLTAAESLCEELMEENESLKADVKDLQQEIEELQDQYREEEIEEFRDLQRELEQIAKNCRILQFKLRKAERARDQTDADRQHLEDKLKDMMSGGNGQADLSDSMRARELESELRIAKEVSVRLHNELEQTEEKRYKLEDENFYLKEKVRELETRAKLTEASRQKIHDIKRAPTATAAQRGATPPTADDANVNMAQLLRDLQDTVERETDLRDQLKFAEDDIQSTHKKLQDLETENEGLLKQLAKLTTPGAGRGGRPPMTRSASEGQTQIQLELAEHEAASLSNKLVRIEKENEHMVTKMSLMEKEVKKHGGKTEFSDDELSNAVPDTYYKQKIKLLEEELEEMRIRLEKEKTRSTTDEQVQAQSTGAWRFGNKRTRTPTEKTTPASRSRSLDQSGDEADKTMMDMKRQVAVSQQETQMLQKRLAALEGTNEKLTEENKKLQILGRRRGSNGDLEKAEQMQKDIDRFVARIAELEAKINEIDEKKSAPTLTAAQHSGSTGNIADMAKENKLLTNKLRDEKENVKKVEAQLLEMKQLLTKSDNQKLIMTASKVEVLTNQLKEATERCNALHKRATTGQQSDYMNALKERCEELERQISVEKAQRIVGGAAPSSANANTAEELEQCCEVLATVEAQMDRVQKQLEKIDSNPKEESRRRSFSKENGAAIASEMAKIKAELEALMIHLQQKKSDDVQDGDTAGGDASTSRLRAELRTAKEQLAKQEKTSHDLREKLELAGIENAVSKQKCDDATARLLQTEERWNKELEKLKESYETQVRDLKYYLEESERQKKEKAAILAEKTSNLTEKTRAAAESELKLSKLQDEIKTKYKDLQERTDLERRKAKEFETKYQKLEELYEMDRKKLSGEREKFKNDLLDLKKRYDETQSDLAKLRQTYTKKQDSWASEKTSLEAELQRAKNELNDLDKTVSKRASDVVSEETRRLVDETVQLKAKHEKEITSLKAQVDGLRSELNSKSSKVDTFKKDDERTKREIDMLKSRVEEQKSQLEDTRRVRDEAREELNKWQQSWARERSDLSHKLRQEEKVQQAETQALQLKFESRIKIMEDTNKNLHSQLAQARRERDQHRESLCTTEKKLTELKQAYETDEKRISDKLLMVEKTTDELKDLRAQVDRLTTENKLNKEGYKTDKHVWAIAKEQLLARIASLEKDLTVTKRWTKPESTKDTENKITDAIKTAEQVRKQGDEFKKFHEKEIIKLNGLLDDTRNVNKKEMQELQRKIRELQESVKVLEIDRRNLLSTKDSYDSARSQLQSERDALLQRIHDTEIHQLANKYKLDKVADQMNDLQAKVRYSEATKSEKNAIEEFANAALRQLMAVREDMARTRELGKALDPLDESFDRVSERSLPVSERMGPVGSESEPPATVDFIRSLRKVSKSPMTIQRKLTTTSEDRSPKLEQKNGNSLSKSAYSSAKIRSYSTDTSSNWEAKIAELRVLRSPSPSPKKLTAYPEAPPNFILNKDKSVEYDKEGKRHYIAKVMTRSISYEPSSNKPLGASDCELDDDVSSTKSHSRTSSTGTNVLYQIRREELAGGNAPSVKRIADAFDAIQKSGSSVAVKRSIFGIRKSRSVETTDTGRHIGQMGRTVLPPGVSPAVLPDSLQSSTESNLNLRHEESPLQRARNPLKGIGSRFVDQVRRSLSRGRRSSSKEKEPKEPKKVAVKVTRKTAKESTEKSHETGVSSSGTSISSTVPTISGVDSDKLYESLVEVYGPNPNRPAMKRYDTSRRSQSAQLPLFQGR